MGKQLDRYLAEKVDGDEVASYRKQLKRMRDWQGNAKQLQEQGLARL